MAVPLKTVREAADAAIRPMRHALRLDHWHVRLHYDRLDDGVMGQCLMYLAHQNAHITIDPEQHDSLKEVLHTLRHELLHLALGYFEQARKTVGQFLQGDPFDACDVAFTLGAEHGVKVIERFLDGGGLTPARLIARGRKELGED